MRCVVQRQCALSRRFSSFSRKTLYSTTTRPQETTTFRLREYQQECIDTCLDHIDQGMNRLGVSLATGGGKTVIFANLIDQFNKKFYPTTARSDAGKVPLSKNGKTVLVLVHRRELVYQAEATIKKFHPHLNVQIELGKQKSWYTLQSELKDCGFQLESAQQKRKRQRIKVMDQLGELHGEPDVVVCSIQSLIRRLLYYDPNCVSLIIIDEAHHAVSQSYIEILNYFNALPTPSSASHLLEKATHTTPPPPIIGFSATFERQDNKALGQIMDKIVYEKGIIEMIEEEWLCDAKFSTVQLQSLDLSQVAVSNATAKADDTPGDFKIPQLSKVMNTAEINEIIVKTYLARREKIKEENSGKISTLLFAVDIQHVLSLHAEFTKYGINCKYVTSLSKPNERSEIVEKFKNSDEEIEVLINCGIFTEGTDIPNINCILLCRPTKSRTLLVQMVGRGLRLHGTKTHCNIIDFVSSSETTGIVSVPTLMGINNCVALEDGQELGFHDLQERKKAESVAETATETQLEDQYQTYISETAPLDITFTTFQSFKDFHLKQVANNNELHPSQIEYTNFKKSDIPWVNHTKNGWAFKIPNTYKHLLINKLPNSEYNLKMLTEIPYVARFQNSNGKNNSCKYQKTEIAKSKDLVELLNKSVEQLLRFPSCCKTVKNTYAQNCTELSISKFSKWRQAKPTDKQKTWISTVVSKHDEIAGDAVLLQTLKQYIDSKMTKGEATDLIFAHSLSKQYPIRKFINHFPQRADTLGARGRKH